MNPSTISQTKDRIKRYQFYKYRTLHSSGPSNWKTVRIPEGWDAKGYFDDISRDHSWSEKFHGVEYKKVKPSKTWLEAEILKLRERANDINQLADDYVWILHKRK